MNLKEITRRSTGKVRRTDQRAAAALVRMQEEDGQPVDPTLKRLAAAEVLVEHRRLSPEERILEVQNALSVVRTEAAGESAEYRDGLMRAWEIIRAALDGEL